MACRLMNDTHPIFLYGSETWTLIAYSEERMQTFETKFMSKLLRISEPKANNWVRSKINVLVGPQKPPPANVTRWKLAWFG